MKLFDISGTKNKEYLKARIDGLETNSKIRNIGELYRGIIDVMEGCRPKTNVVKDEKGN
jgi:hypothetical protein